MALKFFNKIYYNSEKLDIACNAFLVKNKIRPGFLIQSIDYNENQNGPTTQGPVTRKILNSLSNYFYIYSTFQGFLITNNIIDSNIINGLNMQNYNDVQFIENNKLIGELIGYPCSGDLDNTNTRKFCYTLYAKNNNFTCDLMSVIAGKNIDNWWKNFIDNINYLFDHYNINISVFYTNKNIYTINEIYNEVLNKNLSEIIKNEIINILYNFFPKIYNLHKNEKINIFDSYDKLSCILTQNNLFYENNNFWKNNCNEIQNKILNL
jgi:hypothetical protein